MKRIFHILFTLGLGILLTLTACSTKVELNANDLEKPKIEKEQMIDLLVEVHIAEALRQYVRVARDSSFVRQRIAHYYNDIFALHKISPKDFEAAFEYYSSNSEEMAGIYEKVLSKISQLEADVQATTVDTTKADSKKPEN